LYHGGRQKQYVLYYLYTVGKPWVLKRRLIIASVDIWL